MNDAEYLFKTDAAEKKRNGRGIYNKKGGSKSKKCTLPGDYLTPAQKKKLSKTIVDVNLREPMTWDEFKALSPDIQKEYLIFLRDRFGVSLRDISSDLFGHAPQFLSNKSCGEFSHLKGIFPKKPKARTDVQIHRWRLWLGKDIPEAETSGKEPFEIEKTDKFYTYRPKIKDAYEGAKNLVHSDCGSDYDDPESKKPRSEDDNPPEKKSGKPIKFTSKMVFDFEDGISFEDISRMDKLVDINVSGSCVITHVEITIEGR